MKRMHAKLSRVRERGAAAVEFALVLLLFMTLVMGGLDFGYFFYSQQVVANAAREGARAGTLTDPAKSSVTATTAATTAASTYMQNYGITCRPSGGTGCIASSNPTPTVGGAATSMIDVVVQYPFVSLTGFMNGIVPNKIYAHGVMRWQ
jgi:Flp pilus assembly protein TadG